MNSESYLMHNMKSLQRLFDLRSDSWCPLQFDLYSLDPIVEMLEILVFCTDVYLSYLRFFGLLQTVISTFRLRYGFSLIIMGLWT